MNKNNLTIDEYFTLIQKKILEKDFTILNLTSNPESIISVYLETINYMMFEYSKDHNDERQLFPYIIVPNDTDWNFTSITLKEFINFLARNKSKTIVNVDISDKLNKNISLSFFEYDKIQNIKSTEQTRKSISLTIFNFKK